MSVKETNLRRRILKPTRLTTPDVENFMKSHAIVHGKTVGKDGQAYDQVVARVLIDPCTGTKNIHYYTDSIETARRIAMKIPKHLRPWLNDEMSTYSFGKKASWHNEIIFFSNRHFGIKEWTGRPSSNNVGPFWSKKVEEKSNNSTDVYVDIWGKMTNVGEVSDIQIDSSQVDSRSTLHQQLYGTH